MDKDLTLKKRIKAYVDKADIKTLETVHAVLEANATGGDWWDEMPENA
jgi:hypothetical protein